MALLAAPALAQDSEAAMQLYNKGVKQLDTGKGDDARRTFEGIIKDYPTSAYAKLAKEGLDKPLTGAIEFKDTAPLSEKEIKKYLELAGARLMVGRPYDAEAGEQAKTLLIQMMVKKKMRAKDVTLVTRDMPDHKVGVTITVVK